MGKLCMFVFQVEDIMDGITSFSPVTPSTINIETSSKPFFSYYLMPSLKLK
jgi:hypothetical protein